MTNSSSQRCYICKCSPKEMNQISKVRSELNVEPKWFKFGLSTTLRAWIRCFECLLHISYRLALKSGMLE